MNKYFFILQAITILLISSSSYSQHKRIYLQDTRLSESNNGWIQFIASDRKHDTQLFTAPNGYQIWMQKIAVINYEQYRYQEYREGKIDRNELQKTLRFYRVDTTELSSAPLITAFNFALAYKNGKLYYLIDQYHTRKYNYIMPADSMNNGKPILIKGFQIYYKGKIYKRNVLIKPMFNNGIYRSKDSLDSVRKYLFFYKHYRSRELVLGNKKYELIVRPMGRNDFKFHKWDHEIYILPYQKNADYDFYNQKRYMMLGDTCYINGYRIVLKSTDTLVNYIDVSITKPQSRDTLYGFQTGNYVRQNLHYNLYDSTHVSFFSKTTKPYILVDFWGSWCGPCIDNMPRMDSIVQKHKNIIDVIGVQCEYDDSIAMHRRFKDSLGVPYYQIFQHLRNEKYRGLIKQMGVILYPSYFLLNREGKILFYGTPPELPALGKLLDSYNKTN
jgi:thiol-disulfide isomerase/thioredoxin